MLPQDQTALLVIDMQEKLFPIVDRSEEILRNVIKAVDAFQIFGAPIIASEQYPEGLGHTIPVLKERLPTVVHKTSFSCYGQEHLKLAIKELSCTHFVLCGIEAHVCVLQTAKDLMQAGYHVTVLNDAITSRSVYDFSTAIGELRDAGVRISSTETVIFELLRGSDSPSFKEISALIKAG